MKIVKSQKEEEKKNIFDKNLRNFVIFGLIFSVFYFESEGIFKDLWDWWKK